MIQTAAIAYSVGGGVLMLTAIGWVMLRRRACEQDGESIPAQQPFPPSSTVAQAEKVYRMVESGMPTREIAQALACSQAEIDLILCLHAVNDKSSAMPENGRVPS